MGASPRKKNTIQRLPANPVEVFSLLGVCALAFWTFQPLRIEEPQDPTQKPILSDAKLSATRSGREIASITPSTTATLEVDCASNAAILVAPTTQRLRFAGRCGVVSVRNTSATTTQSVAVFQNSGQFTTAYMAVPAADSTLEFEIREPGATQSRMLTRKIALK